MKSRAAPGVSGEFSVQVFALYPTECAIENKRRKALGLGGSIYPGEHRALYKNSASLTADTGIDQWLTKPFVDVAEGDVFISGLGLGMMLDALLTNALVSSITVVEMEADIITLVEPHYRCEKLRVLQGDALTHQIDRSYTCAWHDIWSVITDQARAEAALLTDRYAPHVDWQMCRGSV